jgi:hypothetical protein
VSRSVPLPLIGGAYSDETKPWTAQDCVNWIPEAAEREGTRSPSILRGAPGLVPFADAPVPPESPPFVAPVRQLHDVEGALFGVVGRGLFQYSPSGVPTYIGVIPGTGRVSMAHNQIDGGYELLIANGSSGYLYSTITGDLTQITDPGFPGMTVVDYADGYLAGIEPHGRFWFHSELRNGAEYNTLDRYDAEAAPDALVTLIVSHREVLVLGDRSGQFFRNTGAATGTFQNSNGTEMEVGCAAPHARERLDNTVYWLGNDLIAYRLAGNQPQRVSTGPVEQAFAKCDGRRAFAFTFEDRGHKIFYLTFPDGHTWGYDVWTNEWHRRESKDLSRWRISALVKSNGQWIAGDYANGQLYRLDWNEQTEAGQELVRRRTSGVIHDNQNEMTLNALELVFDTGRAAPPHEAPALSITGHLPDGHDGDTGSYAYTTAGGTAPRTVTLIDGALPSGAALAPTGVVSYTYDTPGDYPFTLQVEDAEGAIATLDDLTVVSGVGDG